MDIAGGAAARGGLEGRRFAWNEDNIAHVWANYRSGWADSPPPPHPAYAYDTNHYADYHALYWEQPDPYTAPCGSFPANGYGLHDMIGNVWEWVWDWYDGNYYGASPTTNPRGPEEGESGMKVYRGGSWVTGAYEARASRRQYMVPGIWNDPGKGFRIAASAGP